VTAATPPLTVPALADGPQPVVLSVIISTYNAREVLADCLRSIYQNPPSEPFEVIVVDDASTDGTSEMTRVLFPNVRLLVNEVNRRYTRSNNRALDGARGQYVCLLNNDTIILPQAFDRMLAFLRQHPDAGAVGSRLLNEDGTTQWSVKPLPSFSAAFFGDRSIFNRMFPNNPFTRRRMPHLHRDLSKSFAAGYISGASKMMPRKVIDDIGYLDPRMFYHADADYCKRIADAGYKCYYLPTATVVHLNHKGGTMVSPRQRFKSLLSFHVDCYVYYLKHMQCRARIPMRLIVVVCLFLNFVILAVVQTATELVTLVRWLVRPKRPAV
jgi:GT2 family glycosyltransferase